MSGGGSGRAALRAAADDGQVREVDLKSPAASERADQPAGLTPVDLPAAAAVRAAQMAVLCLRQDMELFAPVGAVGVADQLQVFEDIQRAVHGRWRCLRVCRAAAIEKLRGGYVALGVGQDAYQETTLRCPPKTPRAQTVAGSRPCSRGSRRRSLHSPQRTNL